MKKGFYHEELYISRYVDGLAVLNLFMFGKVIETNRTQMTTSNIIIGRNQFLIEIWNNGSYVPKRGDVFVYRGKVLVVNTAKEDQLHLYYFIDASLRADLSEVKKEREVIRLQGAFDGQIIPLELRSITETFDSSGWLLFDIAFFTETGTPVNYVGYERLDPTASTIKLVIESDTTFDGYLVVTRI